MINGVNLISSRARRALGIIKVIAYHGISHFYRRLIHREEKSFAFRFRLILEELGPLFVKFGQVMSTRPDLLPPDYLQELRKLQDSASVFDPHQAKATVEKELGRPIPELFSEFDPHPTASASLAQVHKAKLQSGQQVAVKVRRPNIVEQIEEDMNTLHYFSLVLSRYIRYFRRMRLKEAVNEFRRIIQLEVDFSNEARNIQRLTKAFSGYPRVKIPRVYHSSPRLLVSEWIEGIKVSNREKLLVEGYHPPDLARLIAGIWIEQVFEKGLFHADPHPGNIFIMSKRKIGLVDMGVIGELDRDDRKNLANLFRAVLHRDPGRIYQILTQMMVFDQSEENKSLRGEISKLLDKYYGKKLREINPGNLIYEIMGRLFRQYEIDPPIRFITLAKTLITLEAVCEDLDPDFDWAKNLRKRFGPLYLRKLLSLNLFDQLIGFVTLPQRVDQILELMKGSKGTRTLDHGGNEQSAESHHRWSMSLSMGLIVFSLILGSTFLLIEKVGPLWKGISVLGLGGYIAGGFTGLLLLTRIFISGRI